MEFYAASHLVGVTMFALLPFILVPVALACTVVGLAVVLFRLAVKKEKP